MKKMFIVVLFLAVCLIGANQSYGNGPSSTRGAESSSMQSDSATRGTDMQQSDSSTRGAQTQQGSKTQPVRLRQASKLIGMDVKNQQGEDLGNISDIIVNSFTGQIVYAIMEGDTGFLGVGDRNFAIPWKSFQPSVSGDELILNIDKERLSRAPYFTRNNWPNFADRRWEVDVYKFYGVSPYWEER
ncbi:MAG: PRC-barrel domain-containing protein [Nitrospirota bacterium]